jgi:hypothetical protein
MSSRGHATGRTTPRLTSRAGSFGGNAVYWGHRDSHTRSNNGEALSRPTKEQGVSTALLDLAHRWGVAPQQTIEGLHRLQDVPMVSRVRNLTTDTGRSRLFATPRSVSSVTQSNKSAHLDCDRPAAAGHPGRCRHHEHKGPL